MNYFGINPIHVNLGKEFPYFLDILYILIESGIEVFQAIELCCTIHEAQKDSLLYSTLEKMNTKIKLGENKLKAIREIKDELPTQAVENWINSVCQSKEQGGGLSQSLQLQSKLLWEERLWKAQKKAQQTSLLLFLPLLFLIFPATLFIIFLPLIIELQNSGFF